MKSALESAAIWGTALAVFGFCYIVGTVIMDLVFPGPNLILPQGW